MLELKPCPFCGKPAKTIVNCVADRIALNVEKWAMLFAAELVKNSPTIIEAEGGGEDGK